MREHQPNARHDQLKSPEPPLSEQSSEQNPDSNEQQFLQALEEDDLLKAESVALSEPDSTEKAQQLLNVARAYARAGDIDQFTRVMQLESVQNHNPQFAYLTTVDVLQTHATAGDVKSTEQLIELAKALSPTHAEQNADQLKTYQSIAERNKPKSRPSGRASRLKRLSKIAGISALMNALIPTQADAQEWAPEFAQFVVEDTIEESGEKTKKFLDQHLANLQKAPQRFFAGKDHVASIQTTTDGNRPATIEYHAGFENNQPSWFIQTNHTSGVSLLDTNLDGIIDRAAFGGQDTTSENHIAQLLLPLGDLKANADFIKTERGGKQEWEPFVVYDIQSNEEGDLHVSVIHFGQRDSKELDTFHAEDVQFELQKKFAQALSRS